MKNQFVIQNLKCGGCANTITKGIDSIEGVSDVKVDIENSIVSFDYTDENQLELIHEKLNQMGYPVDTDENNFFKKAKSYASCVVGRMS